MTQEKLGKVALITGAGQGIGRCIVGKMLEEGYLVVIADLDGEAAKESAARLCTPARALVCQVDVADEAAVQGMFEHILSRFGRIDALINNAALASPRMAPLESLELRDWNRLLATNLTGVFRLSLLCSLRAAVD